MDEPVTITLSEITYDLIASRRHASACPHSYCWTSRGTYISTRDPAEIIASGREEHEKWRRLLLRMAGRGYDSFLVWLGGLVFARIDIDPYTEDVWCKLFDHARDEYPDR